MSQLQNCIVMCSKNGSYCENEKKEKKSGGGGMCTKDGSHCEKEKNGGGGGGGGGLGGVWGGGRVDANGEVKYL